MNQPILELEAASTLEPIPGLGRRVKAVVTRRLENIRFGELTIVDREGALRFGDPESGPRATLSVRGPALYWKLLFRGPLGGAESYMDGDWESDDAFEAGFAFFTPLEASCLHEDEPDQSLI